MSLNIANWLKKRVNIKITLTEDSFISKEETADYVPYDSTEIYINLELKNKGNGKTQLAGVEFECDLNELAPGPMELFEMSGRNMGPINHLDVPGNLYKNFKLRKKYGLKLPKTITKLKARITFKFTHKKITKNIILTRGE
jgi:hypothetical protein